MIVSDWVKILLPIWVAIIALNIIATMNGPADGPSAAMELSILFFFTWTPTTIISWFAAIKIFRRRVESTKPLGSLILSAVLFVTPIIAFTATSLVAEYYY